MVLERAVPMFEDWVAPCLPCRDAGSFDVVRLYLGVEADTWRERLAANPVVPLSWEKNRKEFEQISSERLKSSVQCVTHNLWQFAALQDDK